MAMQEDDHFRAWTKTPSQPVLLAHPGDMTATELVWKERSKGLLAGGLLAGMGGFICCFAMAPMFMVVLLGWVVFVARRRAEPA